MSRVSSPSSVSPSATGGGSNSPDTGRKTQTSVSSGGLGVTREVANIGGVSITGGASVELMPGRLDISVDPTKGTVSIAGGAELPGGLLGFGGGVTIDTSTGEITETSIGGEIAGLGLEVSNSKDGGKGVSVSLQIPFTPIELELGFEFPSEKKEPTPKPPTPTPSLPPPGLPMPPPSAPNLSCKKYFVSWTSKTKLERDYYNNSPPISGNSKLYPVNKEITYEQQIRKGYPAYANLSDTEIAQLFGVSLNNPTAVFVEQFRPVRYYYYSVGNGISWSGVEFKEIVSTNPFSLNYATDMTISSSWHNITSTGTGFLSNVDFKQVNYARERMGYDFKNYLIIWSEWQYTGEIVYELKCGDVILPPSPPSPTPFPNPPPRKEKMDECCKLSIKLQRLIIRHLGATSPSSQENLPDGVRGVGSTQEGIRQAYPYVVKKRWIDPNAKETEGIAILNDRQLALVLGGMIERLERVLGTSEFYKDSDKKLRQSEANILSWLTGKNNDFKYPDPNDFWLNTDDGIINEKTLEVRSIADGLRYQIEALNRLERILPIAELKDSSIPARWIYPNGKGQLRVGNLIHLCEYMIRKSDKDMGYWPQKITIKAANPAIKDDEAITTDVHSQADMLRVMMQQILDIEGDGDMGSNYDLRRTYLDIMAFQMITKSTKYLEAITEYLGFDITEEVSKVSIPFDPFAGQERSVIEEWWIKYGFGEAKTNFPTKNTESEIEQLSTGLLQNSELEVNTIKFGSVEAKKEPKTLKEALIEILKHSSASAAAVTEVATENALDRVVDAAGIAQKLASFLMRRDIREALGIGDLDNWISSAEKGYTDNLETESLRFPESNSLEPYGRPATQNPTIREIDTKDTKAD